MYIGYSSMNILPCQPAFKSNKITFADYSDSVYTVDNKRMFKK